MQCDYERCPMNAVFNKQGQGYIGFCTIPHTESGPNTVKINMDGQCSVLRKLLIWFNGDTVPWIGDRLSEGL